MKLLLLTDIPPCHNYTAGLVLDQLCRFLPPGSLSCFAAISGLTDAHPTADLTWIPYRGVMGPRVSSPGLRPRWLGRTLGAAMDLHVSAATLPRLVKRAVKFARRFQPDAVWATLEGPTLIRLALPVARRLGVPLLTQVFDPPHWWMRAHNHGWLTTRRVLGGFDRAMRDSQGCAAASWAMAETYRDDYGVRAVPVVPSMNASLARPPAEAPHRDDELVIGLAGQIYATTEWEALLAAIKLADWTIAGRRVRVRVLGRNLQCAVSNPARIEFLGWHSHAQTVHLLSQMDILYCPYWFDPTFEREARLSFPSKLTSYLAAGRPVFMHCPEYASPGRFVRQHGAGHNCQSLDPQQIAVELSAIVESSRTYARLARQGSQAFHRFLTLQCYRRSFADFLGVDEGFLRPVEEARMNSDRK